MIKLKTVIIVFILFAFGFVYPEAKKQQSSPNILVITVGGLRFDHVSSYGYKEKTTPNIDRLVKKGVIFEQAISQSVWSLPSLVSMLSSLYPSYHNLTHFSSEDTLCKNIPTLPKLLKSENYKTAFITDSPDILQLKLSGFDYFIQRGDSNDIGKESNKFLKKAKNSNFLLWVHYNNQIDFQRKYDHDYYVNKYDSQIKDIDKKIGTLISQMYSLGLVKNTIIVFSAASGECLGEHGIPLVRYCVPWEEMIRVPLIIYYPESLPKNKKITTQVQLIDIVPTLLDILGMEIPSSVEGESLLYLISGGEYIQEYALSELDVNIFRESAVSAGGIKSIVSIRTDTWKLIYPFAVLENNARWDNELISKFGEKVITTIEEQFNKPKLFNLQKDPREQDNVFGKPETDKIVKDLKKIVSEKLLEEKTFIDDDTREKLKSLGYMQ